MKLIKPAFASLPFCLLAAPALADETMDHSKMDHSKMDHSAHADMVAEPNTDADPAASAQTVTAKVNGLVCDHVLRGIPHSRAYPFTAFIPPLNLVAAAFVLGEPVGGLHVLGMALVAVGVWILAGRER